VGPARKSGGLTANLRNTPTTSCSRCFDRVAIRIVARIGSTKLSSVAGTSFELVPMACRIECPTLRLSSANRLESCFRPENRWPTRPPGYFQVTSFLVMSGYRGAGNQRYVSARRAAPLSHSATVERRAAKGEKQGAGSPSSTLGWQLCPKSAPPLRLHSVAASLHWVIRAANCVRRCCEVVV
jgi:hypothetical protein